MAPAVAGAILTVSALGYCTVTATGLDAMPFVTT